MSPKVRICLLLLLTPLLPAADQPLGDSGIPEPFDAGLADQLLTHSPFTRIVNLEDTLQLTGVAYVDGRPVATFLNKSTNEHVTVSEQPNAQGWKLTEAIPGAEPQETKVHVMIGSEEITMHYGDAQLTPGATKNGNPGVFVEGSSRHDGRSSSSSDDHHVKTSSLLGENGKELYVSLSREARDKLKEIVHAHLDKHPDETKEQQSAYAQKVYAKIKAADTSGSSSSVKPSKTPKPSKNR